MTNKESMLEAVAYLRSLPAGKVPFELFSELSRLLVLSTAELVILKKYDDDEPTSVLLTQRSPDDKWWPNQWHVPGAVILPNDAINHSLDATTALKRVLAELGEVNINITNESLYAFTELHKTLRGSEHTAVFYNVLNDNDHADDERFFAVNDLPENTIPRHVKVIQKIIKKLDN